MKRLLMTVFLMVCICAVISRPVGDDGKGTFFMDEQRLIIITDMVDL